MNSSELDQWNSNFRLSTSQNESPHMVKRRLTATRRSLCQDTTLSGAAFRTKKRERSVFNTMFWQAVWASFLIFVACTLLNKQGIAVRPLPLGILIQQRGGLFYQTAKWIALVTVTSTTPTKTLWNFTTILEAEITKVRTRFPDLASNWSHRLDICREYLQHFHLKRQKRAPLGFLADCLTPCLGW